MPNCRDGDCKGCYRRNGSLLYRCLRRGGVFAQGTKSDRRGGLSGATWCSFHRLYHRIVFPEDRPQRFPGKCSLICQALWGAIGYTLPATFGSLIAAPQRRHILFIGDGSFQLTAQELSSILRYKQKPIIFLINNDGYTIERLILGETSSYNDVQPWQYAKLCSVFGDSADLERRRVSTVGELEGALVATVASGKCHFIELVMERMDAPQALKTLGPVYAKQDYGTSWALNNERK